MISFKTDIDGVQSTSASDITFSQPDDNEFTAPAADPRADACVLLGDGSYSCWPRCAREASRTDREGSIDRDLEIFRIASEHFRHDLTAFWTHSSFFLLVQGAMISVFVSVVGPQKDGGLASARSQAGLIASAGLVFALFWTWVAFRRRVLISAWREQVRHLDGVVDQHGVYLRVEALVDPAKDPVRSKRLRRWQHLWYGPTAFTSLLPIPIALFWSVTLLDLWIVAGPMSSS